MQLLKKLKLTPRFLSKNYHFMLLSFEIIVTGNFVKWFMFKYIDHCLAMQGSDKVVDRLIKLLIIWWWQWLNRNSIIWSFSTLWKGMPTLRVCFVRLMFPWAFELGWFSQTMLSISSTFYSIFREMVTYRE